MDLKPRDDGKTRHRHRHDDDQPVLSRPAPQLISGCKLVLKQLPDVNEVDVKLVMDPPWTPDKMTEEARDQLGFF